MLSYSIIQKSQLEGAHRLDAEYYQPEFIEMVNMINLNRNAELRDLTVWIKKGIFDLSPDNYRDDGIPFIRTLGINDPLIDFSETVFLDKNTHQKNKTTTLSSGDIVFTKIGANIGKSAILPPTFNEYNFSQNVAGAKVKQGIIKSGYLLAYLLSKFGKGQIDRAQMISGQSKLELEDLRKLKIVITNDGIQQEINSLVLQAQDLKDQSLKSYQQADNLLLEELELNDFQVEDDLSFVVNLSDVNNANRVDAEHFQLKYDKLLEKIKQNNSQVLIGVIENVNAKFDPAKTPDSEFKYVELANINPLIGVIDGYTEVSGKEAPSRAKRLLKKGDVIVSSIEGSLEKIALVDDEQDGYIASTGFFQFRSKELLPEVILILAKSMVLQWQFKKHCAGTILTAVPSESLQKMYVPAIPKPTQQKIAELVKKSHEARKKSKELLEEAKRKVEEMIEKGGDN